MTHVLPFASPGVRAAIGTNKYATKATPVAADEMFIGDSADAFKIKRATLTSLLSGAPDTSITEGVLGNATGARTVPMNNQSLTIDNSSAFTVNSSGAATMNTEGLIINPSSGGTAGFIGLHDGDSSNTTFIASALDATSNYTMTLLAAPPAATSVLTMTNSGTLGTASLHERPYRGLYDASTNLYPTSATAQQRTGDAIQAGDYFPIEVAGTLGGTAVVPGDVLYAEVDMTDPQTTTAANWTINKGVVGAAADTHLMSDNRTNTTGSAILHSGNSQDWGIQGIQNLTMQATTAQAITGAQNVWGWNSAATVNLGGYTTGNKLEGVVGTAVQSAGFTATGDLVQLPLAGAGADGHIFDDTLPNQAGNASHTQAGFDVTFDQSTANSAIIMDNGVNAVAIQDGSLKIRRGTGQPWVTVGTELIGGLSYALDLTTTQANLS